MGCVNRRGGEGIVGNELWNGARALHRPSDGGLPLKFRRSRTLGDPGERKMRKNLSASALSNYSMIGGLVVHIGMRSARGIRKDLSGVVKSVFDVRGWVRVSEIFISMSAPTLRTLPWQQQYHTTGWNGCYIQYHICPPTQHRLFEAVHSHVRVAFFQPRRTHWQAGYGRIS